MTPTSADGEEQISIRGGSQSPLIYALRGCAGIRIEIMSAKADPDLTAKLACEFWLSLFNQYGVVMYNKQIYLICRKTPHFSYEECQA